MKEFFSCYIKILSPVHIGCDEVYEPMGFLVNEQQKILTVFDPVSFISSLEDMEQQKFIAIASRGDLSSILEIYHFLQGRNHPGRTIDLCQGFIERYRTTLSIPKNDQKKIQQDLNQFKIERTSFLAGDQRPYIPGTSIKGSIRTAYLNMINKKKKLTEEKGRYAHNNLEKKLLDGTFETDPFRLVKVSDFHPVGDIRTKIVFAVNEKKKESIHDARGPYQILETILPGAVFEGSIIIEDPPEKSGIKRPLTKEIMIKCLNNFYYSEKNREESELASINITPEIHFDTQNAPLRIGRHSGAESVTIEGHRSIKILGKKGDPPRNGKKATTFWLSSEQSKPSDKKALLPFGWCELTELTEKDNERFKEQEIAFQTQWAEDKQAQKEAREGQARELQRQEELKKEKEAEEQRQREEAERRKAEWDAMSSEDRVIAELNEPEISENRVVDIFNQLESFPEEKRGDIAMGIKNYWVANNKWIAKTCTKKQKEKVNKIKSILGE